MNISVGNKLDRDLTFRERLIIRLAGSFDWARFSPTRQLDGAREIMGRVDGIIRIVDEENNKTQKPVE